jgi:hypothetical protein
MLSLEIGEYGSQEWENLANRFIDHNLIQTWEYGSAKVDAGNWRVERAVFSLNGQIRGIVQILFRPLPMLSPRSRFSRGLVWINRGPLCRLDNGESGDMAQMLTLLSNHYARSSDNYVLVAPTAPVERGGVAATPALYIGLSPSGRHGWSSATIDLGPSLEDLRLGLAQKWRNALNKAERQNCRVEQADSGPVFDDFLKCHAEFSVHRQLDGTLGVDFIQALQKHLPDHRKLQALVAYEDNTPIGSALFAKYGGSAEYLAGNSNDRGRQMNSGQLLLWRAIVMMKERGVARFDVGGMDAEQTPTGIYKFKQGLGGSAYRLADELESTGHGPYGSLVRLATQIIRQPD